MKCSVVNCDAPHRIMVQIPGFDAHQPLCGPHAISLASQVLNKEHESKTLAPVINIKTRKRIDSWSERYSSGIGHTLNQMYNIIWPEGPKTMGSDITNISRMMADPVKREQTVYKIKHPIQTMSHSAQMTIHNLKTKLMGPTEEKPVVNEGPDPNKINDNNYMRWYHDTLPKAANIAWNERYAMAKDDTIGTLRVKLQDNLDKWKDARSAPHTWLKNYNDTISNNGGHKDLAEVCSTNAAQARQMAITMPALNTNARWWGDLEFKHRGMSANEVFNK